jgi:membrane fusion protein (multidrug efflux system)
VVLVAVGVAVWWHSTFTEDTDDAQVNGHLIQVSSRIAGQVIKVDVEENQVVKAGDTIAELDPRTSTWRSRTRRRPWPTPRPTPRRPT